MIQVIAFILFVTLANVDSWAGCSSVTYTKNVYAQGWKNSGCNCDYWGNCSPSISEIKNTLENSCEPEIQVGTGYYIFGYFAGGNTCSSYSNDNQCGNVGADCYNIAGYCTYTTYCNDKCSADSLACVNQGGNWAFSNTNNQLQCGGKSCQICKDTSWTTYGCVYDVAKGQYKNSIIYHEIKDCLPLQQQTDYYASKCDSSSNDSSLTCMGSTDGVNVYVRGGRGKITTCEADGSCGLAIQKIIAGQCENPNDTPKPNSSGGGGSSSSGWSSSSDNPYSSSSGENSSGSGGGNDGDYSEILDTLHMMHKTQESIDSGVWGMYPYISGLYDGQIELNGTTHDINQNLLTGLDFLSEIRDNTNRLDNIESKTNSIDSKLSTTNSNLSSINSNIDGVKTNTANINRHIQETNELLTNLNAKNWSPEINVEVGGDTNIINVDNQVTVQGDTTIVNITNNVDTSHAPKVIEGLFDNYINAFNSFVDKFTGIFGDTTNPYNSSDTVGTGNREKSLIDSIENKINGDTVPNMRDSLPRAVGNAKTALQTLKDTINHSAYGDSVNAWTNKLLNNGVLSGNGSNSCPQFLQRDFSWDMGPRLGTWHLGKFMYICEPIAGINVTLWQLARTILRAMVAVSCMIWLYRVVVGIDGGSNDED